MLYFYKVILSTSPNRAFSCSVGKSVGGYLWEESSPGCWAAAGQPIPDCWEKAPTDAHPAHTMESFTLLTMLLKYRHNKHLNGWRHLILCAYGGDDLTVVATEVVQGHDSSMLVDDINDGLGHSAMVESWLTMLTQLLSIHQSINVTINHSTAQLINL